MVLRDDLSAILERGLRNITASRLGVLFYTFRILFLSLRFFNSNAGVPKMAFRALFPYTYCVNVLR